MTRGHHIKACYFVIDTGSGVDIAAADSSAVACICLDETALDRDAVSVFILAASDTCSILSAVRFVCAVLL